MKIKEVTTLQCYLERSAFAEMGILPTVHTRKLANLKELNVSYNKLSSIPPELGDCENLEKLELTANVNLTELPFELSNLKKLKHLDLAENKFATIPVSVLRMSSLQWLDISKNSLRDLPEDIDRLEELQTFFLHKNKLKYLPMSTVNMINLKMLVVSGDELTSLPSSLTENPDLKFIKLFDNPVGLDVSEDTKDQVFEQTEHDREFMQTYIETLKDRGETRVLQVFTVTQRRSGMKQATNSARRTVQAPNRNGGPGMTDF
ncbi:hypothetical protein QTP70_013202 [Hemibagrus guttatus]|uniref:Leucine-rich repeat-containing protein n=1 Tax=Hemibagrus guttatus TaxID=175788 RepID=A0AAE0R1U7_9TELE|nr:hypothetical protein QTP70_013202 [Hemibagrus guttatus]